MNRNPSSLDRLCTVMMDTAEQVRPSLEALVGNPVRFRLGRGRRTCHQFFPRESCHRITLGRHCIEDHLHGELNCWGHVREIPRENLPVNRNRVDELLMHVLLHEAAHAVQVQRGGRQRGSVHNAVFYEALRELHAMPIVARARNALSRTVRALGNAVLAVDDPRRKPAVERPASGCTRTASALWNQGWDQPDFRVGQSIFFLHRARHVYGVIERINEKTVSVRTAEGRWRISPALLSPAGPESADPALTFIVVEPPPSAAFRVGQSVAFSHRRRRHVGVVERVNQKTVSVRTKQGGYRVPPSLLQAVPSSTDHPS